MSEAGGDVLDCGGCVYGQQGVAAAVVIEERRGLDSEDLLAVKDRGLRVVGTPLAAREEPLDRELVGLNQLDCERLEPAKFETDAFELRDNDGGRPPTASTEED